MVRTPGPPQSAADTLSLNHSRQAAASKGIIARFRLSQSILPRSTCPGLSPFLGGPFHPWGGEEAQGGKRTARLPGPLCAPASV